VNNAERSKRFPDAFAGLLASRSVGIRQQQDKFLAAKVSSACCVSDSASPLPHFLVQLPGWTILASRLAREWPSRSGPQTPACGSGGARGKSPPRPNVKLFRRRIAESDRRKTTSDTFAVSSPKGKSKPASDGQARTGLDPIKHFGFLNASRESATRCIVAICLHSAVHMTGIISFGQFLPLPQAMR